ncbi:MAG: hypothetical protein AMS27_08185 [Bacteroides sp. SM23_62_1]|nr:MAG: hypothetical protein AMS27_08185 [Bacteroides sp. SM23_62_1]
MKENAYIELKSRLLKECERVQKKVVDSAKAAMDEVQLALNEYGPNKDRYDSFRDQLIGKRDMFSTQYQKAHSEFTVLHKINSKNINKIVEFGSVVLTDSCKFFISISAGKIIIDGQTYYAISPMVPLYKAMEGMKKGDVFEFNGKKQTIQDLF